MPLPTPKADETQDARLRRFLEAQGIDVDEATKGTIMDKPIMSYSKESLAAVLTWYHKQLEEERGKATQRVLEGFKRLRA